MTRFAKCDSLKSVNKHIIEDETPWEELRISENEYSGKKKKRKIFEEGGDESAKKVKNLDSEIYLQDDNDLDVNFVVEDSAKKEKKMKEKLENKKKTRESKDFKAPIQKKLDFIMEDGIKYKISKKGKKRPWVDLVYKENDDMTMYTKLYVKKSDLEHLDDYKKKLKEEGFSERKIIKKLFTRERRAHNKLRVELMKQQMQTLKIQNINNRNNEYNNPNEKVKFAGIFVTKQGAKRLQELKNNLKKKGCSREELRDAMKYERRREERELKRLNKLICYNCRKLGHAVSQCQQNKSMNVCYKCGSVDHIARDCNVQGSFAHASCFYCNETGHIARECPDNPKKLYINGGGCRECGSVEHFIRDCPEFQKEKKENEITPKMINTGADLDF